MNTNSKTARERRVFDHKRVWYNIKPGDPVPKTIKNNQLIPHSTEKRAIPKYARWTGKKGQNK